MDIRRRKYDCEGSVTVEACFMVPLFLFFFLAIANILMIFFAEGHIYQSLAEASEYTSQYCYLQDRLLENSESLNKTTVAKTGTLIQKFHQYLGDDFYVEKVVTDGKKGIYLSLLTDENNQKIFHAKASYKIRFNIPVFGTFSMKRKVDIKQKGFVGYTKGEEEVEEYVYVTPNQEVYHCSRSCSHLVLSIRSLSKKQAGHYNPCHFCGKNPVSSNTIYITKSSSLYHTEKSCSGLKRTVKRVKKSTVGGLPPCKRCGR